MSDTTENPYESPLAEAGAVNPLTNRVLTEDMLYYLKGVSPWLRFIGIAGFVTIGIMAISMIALSFGMSKMIPDNSEFAAFKILGSGIFIIYLPFLAIYFFPVLFMFRFGKYLKSYLFTNDNRDLEEAFKNNKSLWTFFGVMLIISLSIMALALVASIITVIFSIVSR